MAARRRRSRRAFLKVAALGVSAPAWALRPAAAGAGAKRRPSFLLVISDDQGGQMGCLGTKGLATPHMDALAGQGVLFRQAFCTFGSCSPARASMLTGLYPHAHGITANVHEHLGPRPPANWPAGRRRHNAFYRVPSGAPTLIELLKKAGYRTGITSKFHLSPHEKFPFDQWIKGNGGEDVARFIEGCDDRPFFLVHNIRSPHRPFGGFIGRARRKIVDPRRVRVPAYLPDTPMMRRDWAQYLTCIEITDAKLGEAMAALKASGRAGEAVVWYTGDNGPAFHRGKYSVYDFGLRVPLIAAGPGIRRGLATDALVSHVDLMPTVADLAGIDLPRPLHGRSLRALLEGRPDPAAAKVIFGEVAFGHGPESAQGRSASDGRLHYIRRIRPDRPHKMPADNFQEKPWGNRSYRATIEAAKAFPLARRLLAQVEGTEPVEELFDLARDPWCMRDVLNDPAYAAGLARLRAEMDRWIRQTNDRAFLSKAPAGGSKEIRT